MSGLRVHLVYCMLILAGVVASASATQMLMSSNSESAVYLIGSVTITDHERLPEYQAIAGPLAAESGGYVPLAFGAPNMIEGEPPTEGLYFIERYDSLAGLRAFVESEAFLEAKKLRDKVAEVHFMMWLPELPPDSLPH